MNKIDKIINIVRNLREEGESAAPVSSIPNVVGNGEKSLGYNIYTGTPPVVLGKKKKKKSNRYAKGGINSRRWWLQYLNK